MFFYDTLSNDYSGILLCPTFCLQNALILSDIDSEKCGNHSSDILVHIAILLASHSCIDGSMLLYC